MKDLNTKTERRNFYRTVFVLVLPMALQNLINVGVQAADVVMLGFVGETAISAASLAGQVYFIMTLLFFGLTSGAAVLTAQYWGKGDINTIEKILGLALRTAFCAAAIFTAAALFFPRQLMMIFSGEEDVIEQGAAYMRIVAIAYIPAAFTMVYLNVMRSVERVIISTIVYLVSLIVNVILNAIFIFGFMGIPALGVVGAAIATASARYVELIIVIIYSLKVNKTVRVRIKNILSTPKVLIGDFVKFAVPVTLNELMWGGGYSMITAVIGHIGKSAAAANSVAQVVRQLAFVVTMGAANAAAIMIGKVIGEGKMEYAKTYASRFMKITVILGLCGSALILIMIPVMKAVMSLGAEAEGYLSGMLAILSYIIILASVNTVMIVGVFRAGGDTKYGLFLDCASLWLVAIPLGFVAAFIWKLPVVITYIVLTSDEIIKLPLSIIRYKSKKWLKSVTRDFKD